MIRVKIKIGSGTAADSFSTYKFIYLSSDNRLSAPLKEFEKTSYPEQSGVNLYPKTVDDTFDYKVEFLVEAGSSLVTANSRIKTFNDALFSQATGSDVKEFKRVTFYNPYKNVMISGIPEPIQEATEFWRDKYGNSSSYARVEWTIHVDKPSECNFNYTETTV